MQKKSWLYGYGSIPINTILMGWTSIYQLFWCSPGVQGFDTLPYIPFLIALNHHFQRVKNPHVPTIDPAPGSSLQRKINEVLVNSREFLGCTVGHLRRWRNHWSWRFNGIWKWGIQWDLLYYICILHYITWFREYGLWLKHVEKRKHQAEQRKIVHNKIMVVSMIIHWSSHGYPWAPSKIILKYKALPFGCLT
jgi:hypothetical protein